jgi:hypothetical protein
MIDVLGRILHALNWNLSLVQDYGDKEQLALQNKAISEIYQLLEAQYQEEKKEPVAYRYKIPVEDGHWVYNFCQYPDSKDDPRLEPLYTSPQPLQQEPDDLTVWKVRALQAEAAIEKFMGKVEKQDPVAMRYDFDGYGFKYIDAGSGSDWQTRIKGAEPLYTSPQPLQQEPFEYWNAVQGWVRVEGDIHICTPPKE